MPINRSAREMVRHLILKSGLNGAYLAFRSAKGENVDHLRTRTLADRFSTIYQNRIWLNERKEGSLSGLGSELERTKSIRDQLPGLLAKLDTQTLLDAGCGDFNWMRDVELNCRYIGIDVAPGVIEFNARNYGSASRTFLTLDATKDLLPAADTVLCREVLFHLSLNDICALIRNLRACKIRTLIATTDAGTGFNADILSGDFRLLNLTKHPFSFPSPTLFISENESAPGRVLAVWNISELPLPRSR